MKTILEQLSDDDGLKVRLRRLLLASGDHAYISEETLIFEAAKELGGCGINRQEALDAEAIKAMLKVGATTSAVLAIMGGESVFMLSRGQKGACLASVLPQAGMEEVFADGPTMALALLRAHLSAVLEVMENKANLLHVSAGIVSVSLH